MRIVMTYYLKQLRYFETLLLEAVDAIKRGQRASGDVILSIRGSKERGVLARRRCATSAEGNRRVPSPLEAERDATRS